MSTFASLHTLKVKPCASSVSRKPYWLLQQLGSVVIDCTHIEYINKIIIELFLQPFIAEFLTALTFVQEAVIHGYCKLEKCVLLTGQ